MNNQTAPGAPWQNAFEDFVISPQTSWNRFINPQFFINYNGSDVGIENHILSEVGSYGMQLGQIIDVLDVLVANTERATLSPREQHAVDDFRDLSDKVKVAKGEEARPRPGDIIGIDDIDRVVDGLSSLAHSNPGARRRLLARLKEGIDEV